MATLANQAVERVCVDRRSCGYSGADVAGYSRLMGRAPPPDFRRVVEEIREMRLAAC